MPDPTSAATWTPILTAGPLTASATYAIDAIIRDVGAHRPSEGEVPFGVRAYRGEDDALLYAYLSAAREDEAWAERAVAALNTAIDGVTHRERRLGLYGGLAGLGWAIEHVPQVLEGMDADPDAAIDDDDDPAAEIDAAILGELRRVPPGEWRGPYDLISGIVGFGVYFLERWPTEGADEGLRLVLEHLDALAGPVDPGVAWHSGPELLPDFQREQCPDGYYNLGVAHGIPGVIHLLSEASALGVERERSDRLLEGAMAWLMAQRRPRGSVSWFHSWVPSPEARDARLAWCYGDMGILAVLRLVARRAGRADWQQFADDLLAHCLAWPAETTGLNEAPLCHGATGVAHIFNRIYQAEGDRRCRDAAVTWFERSLAMRKPGAGAGGFLAMKRPDPNGPMVWEPILSFLDGAVGVALALLSAIAPVAPHWDRLIAASGRAR